jgi:4-hydroxy-tetrahydrodipicolinate reductase
MKLAVMGASGRMGQALIRQIIETDNLELAGATEAPGHEALGADLGKLVGLGPIGVSLTDDPLALVTHIEGVLDFTIPKATLEMSTLSAQARIVHVIGTTGFSAGEEETLKIAARHATLIKSGNMSLGVNFLAAMTAKAAEALGPDWDIEILEMHHRHKVDAPSGTALLLGEAAAKGRGIKLQDHTDAGREGKTGARKSGDIGFASLRGGSVVGEHSVIFASDGERIELTHKAADRSIFVKGALAAARWGKGKGPGYFSMVDVLGL